MFYFTIFVVSTCYFLELCVFVRVCARQHSTVKGRVLILSLQVIIIFDIN
jgi:hypothetical protein